MTEVIEALRHQVDARWRHFGTLLHFEHALMDTIETHNERSTDCMLDLVTKWMTLCDGTGWLPRTWETVVKAVKGSGCAQLAKELAKEFGTEGKVANRWLSDNVPLSLCHLIHHEVQLNTLQIHCN